MARSAEVGHLERTLAEMEQREHARQLAYYGQHHSTYTDPSLIAARSALLHKTSTLRTFIASLNSQHQPAHQQQHEQPQQQPGTAIDLEQAQTEDAFDTLIGSLTHKLSSRLQRV